MLTGQLDHDLPHPHTAAIEKPGSLSGRSSRPGSPNAVILAPQILGRRREPRKPRLTLSILSWLHRSLPPIVPSQSPVLELSMTALPSAPYRGSYSGASIQISVSGLEVTSSFACNYQHLTKTLWHLMDPQLDVRARLVRLQPAAAGT